MIKKDDPLSWLKKRKTDIAFAELVHILADNGFAEQSIKGSHYTFGKPGKLQIMIVKPRSGKKSCHPMDVNKVIKMLEAISED